jgi:hypothetical protein
MSKGNPATETNGTLRTLIFVIIGGVVGMVGGVVGQYYASKFQYAVQTQLQIHQGQREVFSRIMGRKFTILQLYASRQEAVINSYYHEALWKHFGSSKDSVDLQESQRLMNRSNQLLDEIIKSNQGLIEDLGTIRALFPDTPKLNGLINRIYDLKALHSYRPPSSTSPDELVLWRDSAIGELEGIIYSNYGVPIDELLDYLSDRLPGNQ